MCMLFDEHGHTKQMVDCLNDSCMIRSLERIAEGSHTFMIPQEFGCIAIHLFKDGLKAPVDSFDVNSVS